jgi:hypothetical protein
MMMMVKCSYLLEEGTRGVMYSGEGAQNVSLQISEHDWLLLELLHEVHIVLHTLLEGEVYLYLHLTEVLLSSLLQDIHLLSLRMEHTTTTTTTTTTNTTTTTKTTLLSSNKSSGCFIPLYSFTLALAPHSIEALQNELLVHHVVGVRHEFEDIKLVWAQILVAQNLLSAHRLVEYFEECIPWPIQQ